jgi:hypothetical protein
MLFGIFFNLSIKAVNDSYLNLNILSNKVISDTNYFIPKISIVEWHN